LSGRGASWYAHIGNWELLAARPSRGSRRRRRRLPPSNDPSARWLETMRRAYGVETLAQQSNPREIVRALALRRRSISLLADLEVPSRRRVGRLLRRARAA
jgi:hypothetical protein